VKAFAIPRQNSVVLRREEIRRKAQEVEGRRMGLWENESVRGGGEGLHIQGIFRENEGNSQVSWTKIEVTVRRERRGGDGKIL